MSYTEFRELFTSHRIQIPEVFLFCNWEYRDDPSQEVFIPNFEYSKMRQLVRLLAELIAANEPIIRKLVAFGAHRVFDFVSSFRTRRNERATAKSKHIDSILFNRTTLNNCDARKTTKNAQKSEERGKRGGHRRYRTATSIEKQCTQNGASTKLFSKDCVEVASQEKMKGAWNRTRLDFSSLQKMLDLEEVRYAKKDVLLLANYLGGFSGCITRESLSFFLQKHSYFDKIAN